MYLGSQWFNPHLLFNLSLSFTKIPLDALEQAMASVFFWDLSHKLDNKQNLHNVLQNPSLTVIETTNVQVIP